MPPVDIGEAIRTAREKRGWSQQRLAGELGVALSTVQNWESGRSEGPRWGEYIQICMVFRWPLPKGIAYSADRATGRYPGSSDLPMPERTFDVALA